MPRFATEIRFTNADGSVEVDFSGCRGYLEGLEQFADDGVRKVKIIASDGTPKFQGLVMGVNPHRGNQFGVVFDAAVAASKVADFYALNEAVKLADSYMKAYLSDAVITLDGQKCQADPDATPYWLTRGRESEGTIEGVRVQLVAI